MEAEARCSNINPKKDAFYYFLGLCHRIYKAIVFIIICRKVGKYTVGNDLEALESLQCSQSIFCTSCWLGPERQAEQVKLQGKARYLTWTIFILYRL